MTMTNKMITTAIILLLAVSSMQAAEATGNATASQVDIVSVFHADANETIGLKNRSTSGSRSILASSYRSSKNMIKMGKTLTFLGIGGMIGGAVCIAAGSGMALQALVASGVLSTLSSVTEWSTAWSSVLLSFGTMSAETLELVTSAIILWALGGALLILSLALIPGIIVWAIGARGRSKRDDDEARAPRMFSLSDEVGFGIRL